MVREAVKSKLALLSEAKAGKTAPKSKKKSSTEKDIKAVKLRLKEAMDALAELEMEDDLDLDLDLDLASHEPVEPSRGKMTPAGSRLGK